MNDFGTIGFIGLGAMGSRMSRNLVQAGYRLVGYDIRPEPIAALVDAGGLAGESAADVVERSDVVLTSLVAHVYLEVVAAALLPNARAEQVFIDHSTVPAPETRRLAAAFAEKGAIALDVPVSGWITGAESGMLAMFVGGDEAVARRYWPLFEVMGDPERIIYGGPAGMGQVMKVVQQLKDRMLNVARLEVMAFGLRAGLGWEQVLRVLNVDPDGDDGYARLCRRIQAGEGDQLQFVFGEWAYYLTEAEAQTIPMPILESLYHFYGAGEYVNQDEQGRPGPSIWRELMTREGPALGLLQGKL
jgi:3-hydroxyisobutyrate dehydrogenase-like beta-hydroxyacid dehydrogenase